MFPIFTKLPQLPIYDYKKILNNFKGSNDDLNKLNQIFTKKNEMVNAFESMNFEELKRLFQDPLTINYLNEVTYLNDILLTFNQEINAEIKTGFSNQIIKSNNKVEIFFTDIILSRISFSLGLLYANRDKFENILKEQINKENFDLDKFKELKNTVYESSVRICKLKNLFVEYFQPNIETIKTEITLSKGFIFLLNDLFECCLSFFWIFFKLDTNSIKDANLVLSQIKVAMNKVNNMQGFLEKINFNFKEDFLYYVLNLKDFYHLMYSYYLLLKYSILIKNVDYSELSYEQCVYNCGLVCDFINTRINNMEKNLDSYNDAFNNKLFSKFIVSFYNSYLKDEVDEKYKLYKNVKDSLKKINDTSYDEILNNIEVKDDLTRKALLNKSGF